jgi:two-component sensor histidine kinase
VAFLALDRLVIRHIRVLSRQMRTFARTRRLVGQPLLGATGRELVEIETDFREMAESILEDEARLEDNLREKNILLKEVHHRVKNNLQLVTSIMNMQIRKAAIPETRAVLRRLQDRVMGLAAVHRALYKAKDFNSIDVSTLVSELAEQLLVSDAAAAPIRAQVEVEPLYLFPDQAVPLSLLASESMTNAVKYAGPNEAGVTRIDVSLKPVEDGRAQFSIVSSRGEPMGRVGDEGTSIEGGLGLQLMRAFEGQLGGRLTITEDEEAYRLDITFPVQTFSPDALDY